MSVAANASAEAAGANVAGIIPDIGIQDQRDWHVHTCLYVLIPSLHCMDRSAVLPHKSYEIHIMTLAKLHERYCARYPA